MLWKTPPNPLNNGAASANFCSFLKKQSDNHTQFIQRFSFFTQILPSLFLCTTKSNTLNSLEQWVSKVCASSSFVQIIMSRHTKDATFLDGDQAGSGMQPGGTCQVWPFRAGKALQMWSDDISKDFSAFYGRSCLHFTVWHEGRQEIQRGPWNRGPQHGIHLKAVSHGDASLKSFC